MKLFIYIFFISLILHLGCSNKKHNLKIFHYNESTGIASLDPAFAKNQSIMWGIHQLYNKLIETDDNMNLKPSLCKSWIISADGLVYTFNIKSNIFFHDNICFTNGKGREMKAQDFAYSLSRIIDKNTASPGAWIFNNCIDTIKTFEAINDTTLKIYLRKPYQPLIGILSMQYCSVVPKEAVEYYKKDFRSNPVGTGPFEFVAWEEGQAMVLKKNKNYFETDANGKKIPYLDGIKISFLDSKATEFLAFQQGNLEFVNDIEASFKDEVITKTGKLKDKWNSKIYMNKVPYLNIEYFGIQMDDKLMPANGKILLNKKIRQAINYGFNRQKMILYIRNSIGIAAESGFVPCGLPSFDSTLVKGYNYNPTKALQFLKEANYNGEKITLITVPIYAELASFVANELAEIGLKIKVETMQKATMLEMTKKGQAPFFRGSWIADYPDAENYFTVFYSKNPAPPNYTRYKNPAFDLLYEKALTQTNLPEKYLTYQAMDRIIIEDAPIVPLWYDMAIHLVHNKVKNFKANSLNLLELRKVDF